MARKKKVICEIVELKKENEKDDFFYNTNR